MDSTLGVRRLRQEDTDRFLALARLLFPDADIRLGEKDEIWLAEQTGRIVGFLHLRPRGRSLYLQGIGVDPTYRRRGIGRRLLETARERAERRAGGGGLSLRVRQTNREALALYHACGFMLERSGAASHRLVWQAPN